MTARRPHPHIAIPPDTGPPHAYAIHSMNGNQEPSYTLASPYTALHPSITLDVPSRPPSRAASVHESPIAFLAFPEPQLYRSSSQRSLLRAAHGYGHRSTQSDLNNLKSSPVILRGESRPPSFISTTNSSPEFTPSVLSDELSNLTLDSEEGLRRFQAGELGDNDEEWHRLVPAEAREVLDDKEVQRQSVLFEIIKSEKDYVSDLRLVREVFVDPLLNTSPMPERRLRGFVSEVFCNLDQILAHHERMLGALFDRQREQHPLIQSVADIILDTTLLFRDEYESYIKHYPLSEARHRSELKHNRKYRFFIQQCSLDPHVRKRDLATFLSRPVTRLPRLQLQLENVRKFTEPDHPDMETLPLLLSILSDFIKSTQPGIAAAEDKVKFWNLCESLEYQKGEIIDMDLYEESRTVVREGSLARRYRAEVGYNWADLTVALLDNYLLLLKPQTRSSGVVRNIVVSRPIPLEYLRLIDFDAPPENRKEKADDGSLFESFRSRNRPMFPFTIYHASAKHSRRYTLYAVSDAIRRKWHDALVNAIGIRKARQEANMWFAPHTINNGFFKSTVSAAGSSATGKISTACPISSGGKNFIVIACPTGIYIATRGEATFNKVLAITNTKSIDILPEFNKFIVHCDQGLFAYSLELLTRVAQGLSPQTHLESSMENIAGPDKAPVLFFHVGRTANRTLIFFASKYFLTLNLYAVEVMQPSQVSAHRRSFVDSLSFRSYGEPLAIPKDSYAITPLLKNIGICSDKGIHIIDLTHLAVSSTNLTIIPTYAGVENNLPMSTLKSRCAGAKPLGVVRCSDTELLVIFDELGCYIDKHGVPTRSSGYLRWESKAVSFAHRGEHILLFCTEFIEIRTLQTGKLVQVMEGEDVRLVHAGVAPEAVLVAMRGEAGRYGVTSTLMELVETAEISSTSSISGVDGIWDEWDM